VVAFLFLIIELFSLSLTVETLQAKICQSRRFSKGVGHFERKFQKEGSSSATKHCWTENYSDCPFMWYQNIRSALFGLVTKHARDRQRDEQNYDSQDVR